MGSTISVDVDAATANAGTALPSDFEDKLRQETLLIPEDIEDIHIQSTLADDIGADTVDTDSVNTGKGTGMGMGTGICVNGIDTPASNTRYGKGKHWKRNMKKYQNKLQSSGGFDNNQHERTIEQRREQVRPIIEKLTELQMNVSYPAIRELYKIISQYIKTGEDTKIKIPFPEFSRKIKGELSNAPYIPCWVKLEMDE